MDISAFQLDTLVRPNVKNLKPYSSARDEHHDLSGIFLDANENPFETGLNRYPDPHQVALKERLAAIKQVNKENIFLGNGSDEAIDLIIRAFCRPGEDNIVIPDPTYGMYQVCATINDIKVRKVQLKADFSLDEDQVLKEIDHQTKLIFLCSPNNPTGNRFSKDAISRIISTFKGIVVIDEAYIDFSTDPGFVSWVQRTPNLIVLQTFSKAWGMAGVRLGMAFSSQEIIEIMNRIKPPYNISTLTQKTALEVLQNVDEVQPKVNIILREKERLYNELATLSMVQQVFRSEANFILARMDQANFIYEQLLKQHIIVRNRSKATLCDQCLRFTVGTKEENDRLISALKNIQSS